MGFNIMGTKVNDAFFSSLSLVSSYWAGFIAADGCVHYDKRNYPTLEIALQVSDMQHLVRFKLDCEAYNSNVNVCNTSYVKQDGSVAEVSKIKLAGVYKMVDDLAGIYNITPRKSHSLLPPNIETKENILAYLAGLIDGDGCIRITTKKEQPGSDTLRIELCGASEPLLYWMSLQIDAYYPFESSLSTITKATVKGKGAKKTYTVTGSRAALFALDIQKLNLPLLQRKWLKAFDFISSHYCDGITDNRIKVTDETVLAIRKDVANGVTRKEAAEKYDVNYKNVNRFVSGSRRAYIEDSLVMPTGKNHTNQMSDEKAREVKDCLTRGLRICEIIKLLDVTKSQVERIKSGKSFKHL